MRFSFRPDWRLTLLTALVLPILLGLGFWQLERAEEKRLLQDRYRERLARDPRTLTSLPRDDLAFRRVALEGRFDGEHPILLDNRSRDGRAGYEVLNPFRTDSGQWVLVNRGWMEAGATRRELPDVPPPGAVRRTRGHVYVPPGEPFLLMEQQFREPRWPLRVQAVEVDKLGGLLERQLFPYVVRLEAGAPGALQVDWQPVSVRPERHTAYAVQWFAMMVALLLWFLFANSNLWALLRHIRNGRPDRTSE